MCLVAAARLAVVVLAVGMGGTRGLPLTGALLAYGGGLAVVSIVRWLTAARVTVPRPVPIPLVRGSSVQLVG